PVTRISHAPSLSFTYASHAGRHQHSFPTRRSSDLVTMHGRCLSGIRIPNSVARLLAVPARSASANDSACERPVSRQRISFITTTPLQEQQEGALMFVLLGFRR